MNARLPAQDDSSHRSDKAQHGSPLKRSRVFYNCNVQSNPASHGTGDQSGFTQPPPVVSCPRGDRSQREVSEPLWRWKAEAGHLMLSHNGPLYTMEPSDISVPAAPLKPKMWQTQTRTHMETLLRRCLFSVYQALQWVRHRAE